MPDVYGDKVNEITPDFLLLCDETAGTTLADYSGNARTFTETSAGIYNQTSVSANMGKAIQGFAGMWRSAVIGLLNLQDKVSFGFWAKSVSVGGDLQTVYYGSNGISRFNIAWRGTGSHWYIELGDGAFAYGPTFNNANLIPSTTDWKYYVVNADFAAGSTSMSVYNVATSTMHWNVQTVTHTAGSFSDINYFVNVANGYWNKWDGYLDGVWHNGGSLINQTQMQEQIDAALGAANTAPVVGTVSIDTATVYADTTPIVASVASVTDAEQTTGPFDLTWKLYKGVTLIKTDADNGLTAAQCVGRTHNFTGFGTIAKADSLTATVTANDGNGGITTSAASAAKIVANSTPVVLTVTLSTLPLGTNNVATASYTASDADTADTLTPTYLWERDTAGNGTFIPKGTNSNTLDLSVAGNGDAGDRVRCTVTVNDGTIDSNSLTSALATIQNVASTFTASIASQNVQEGAVLSLQATATDSDGDPISFSLLTDASGGAATLTPDVQVGNDRQVTFAWTVPIDAAVTPSRAFTIRATSTGGTADMSFTLTVQNTAPVLAAIANQSVNRGSTLEIPISLTDANGQSINFDENYLVFEQPPATPIAKPAWITLVQLTAITAKLVVSPLLAGNSEDIRIKVKFPDGVI